MDPSRKRSWERYWKAMRRWAPDARSPFDLYADRLLEMPSGARWLDAGCGRSSFAAWRKTDEKRLEERGVRFVGCDLDRAALEDRAERRTVCIARLERLPYPDATFDFVSSNMVFEHLQQPEPAVAELVRVTRPGGRILVHTVNARHYLALIARATPLRFHRWLVKRVEGRAPEAVYPTAYRANTEERLRGLFRERGCTLVWGGQVSGMPVHVPYPGLFWLAFGAGLTEGRLARAPLLRHLLRPNLLVEFLRTPSSPAARGAA